MPDLSMPTSNELILPEHMQAPAGTPTPDLMLKPEKKSVVDWLKEVDYKKMNDGYRVPSNFALEFATIIQLINGEQGEENNTPAVHLAMLDNICGKRTHTVNLCHRGLGKTTLMFEYLVLYLALKNHIPGFGAVNGILYVSNSMKKGVADARRNLEERFMDSKFMMSHIRKYNFTEDYIYFENNDHGKRINGKIVNGKLGIRMFGAESSPRGVRIFKKRPVLALIDDIIGDGDAPSKPIMDKIKETVFSGITYALHPNRKKIILSGTPFVNNDIMYEAVESGGWYANVYPVCQKFPCTREEFVGSWEERFDYDYVKGAYDDAVANNKLASFYKELMLQITNEEDRLVQDTEIQWYDRDQLLRHRSNFNFYVTTDFSFAGKIKSDFSVISVWAYNNNGDWFWVDGMCDTCKIDVALDKLTELCQIYKPKTVGIERSGQQGGIIDMLLRQMRDRNVSFTLARQKGVPGILPRWGEDKLARFNSVVPWFREGKFFFPEQMRYGPIMREFVKELEMATLYKLKGHDDCLDTISMLSAMNAKMPSHEALPVHRSKYYQFALDDHDDNNSPLDDLIV